MRVVWVFQHDDAETPALIQAVLQRQELALVTFRPDRKALPEKLADDCSALVVMGGPMSVYDTEKHPWIAHELALIREAITSARPVLAICLGSQLLAAAGGADVISGGPPKEVGWGTIKLTDAGRKDPLSKFLANPATEERTTVFQWHGDTFGLPPGATLLASSPRFPQQAFRLGRAAYGFQFHFEITEQIIRHWVDLWKGDVRAGETTTEDIFAGLKEYLPLLNRRGEEIVRAFAALIQVSPMRVLAAEANDGKPKSAKRRRRIASMAEIDAFLPPSQVELEEEARMQKLDRLHGLRHLVEHAETEAALEGEATEVPPAQPQPSQERPRKRDRLEGVRRESEGSKADPVAGAGHTETAPPPHRKESF